jgi:hypothetical protein
MISLESVLKFFILIILYAETREKVHPWSNRFQGLPMQTFVMAGLGNPWRLIFRMGEQ